MAVVACGKDATGSNGPVGVLAVTPDTVRFGALAIDLLSAPETLTVTNTGGVAVKYMGVVDNGSDGLNFVGNGGDCRFDTEILPGNSCRVSFVFEPVSPVGDKQASIGILTDPAAAGATVVLEGTALAEP
jgi:hypothetical protein